MIKLLLYTNSPAPYRVDFFNLLGKQIDLKVIYQDKTSIERNSDWFSYDFNNFTTEFLNVSSYKNFFQIKYKLKKTINDFNPDVIFNCDYSSAGGIALSRIAKNKNIPLVIEADGGLPKDFNFIIKNIIKHELCLADYCLSSSDMTDEYFLYYGVSIKKLYRYTFTSLKKVEIENNMKNCRTIINDKIKLLSVGQIIHRKGYDLLLEILADFKDDVECLIVGGNITENLKLIVDKHQLNNVKFIDYKPKEELNEIYRNADMFVFPTREDIWGLVINEAISFKLPILSSDNCLAGCHFVNNYDCGMLFENENIQDLKDKLRKMINDKNQLSVYSENCILANKNNDMETMVEDHMIFLNKFINEGKGL